MEPALYWEKVNDKKVQCLLCPQNCVIAEGKKGFCRVRSNSEGKLYSLNYGQATSYGMDPIEKKPLYHFYPGKNVFSIGTFGCNLRCGFCQNWTIAHGEEPRTVGITPSQVVEAAQREKSRDNIGIAYTYSEPLMWYEFVLEAAKLAHQQGLKNILVTNGFINHHPMEELLPYIDAMNIDVKAFNDEFYNTTCAGELHPVQEIAELVHDKCHIEITTLLVTGLNDSCEEVAELAGWIADLDPNIPLHLTRYFPNYKMELPPTPIDTMTRARETALKKLKFVYMGNVQSATGRNTYCPDCGELLINRTGYYTNKQGLEGNRCIGCGRDLAITGL